MLLQGTEWDYLEGPCVGGRQHHVSGRAVLVRPQPVHRGDAPSVAWNQPGEPVFRPRRAEVVADVTLVIEKLRRHHCADRVTSPVLGTRAAGPIPIEAREGVGPAGLEVSSEDIAIGHRTSMPAPADVEWVSPTNGPLLAPEPRSPSGLAPPPMRLAHLSDPHFGHEDSKSSRRSSTTVGAASECDRPQRRPTTPFVAPPARSAASIVGAGRAGRRTRPGQGPPTAASVARAPAHRPGGRSSAAAAPPRVALRPARPPAAVLHRPPPRLPGPR